jgi:hypothetical protein
MMMEEGNGGLHNQKYQRQHEKQMNFCARLSPHEMLSG